MATLSNKHENHEILMYSDFGGGLQLSRPAEVLAANEMQVCENFEYSPATGALKLRGGCVLMGTFSTTVTGMAPLSGNASVLVRTQDGRVYRMDEYAISSNLGTLPGSGPLSYTLWGDANELLLCAGAQLYRYAGGMLSRIDSSPQRCDFVFVRAGRVVTVDSSSDSLRYSGVGDPGNWNFEGTDSDAQELEVGYKDGCSLVCVAPLTSDLVVFKAPPGQPGQGRIYRVLGEYPDWEIKSHSQGASAWNHRSAATTTSDLLFMTAEGVASLGTVSDYGDIKMKWAGAKVNAQLAAEVGADARVWKMPHKQQVWVRTKPSAAIWVYNYGVEAWTSFRFSHTVEDACTVGRHCYVATGHQIFRLDDTLGTDNGDPFTGRVRMQAIVKRHMVLLKGVYVAYNSMSASRGQLVVQGHKIELPLGGQVRDMAALDADIAALDDGDLMSAVSSSVRRRLNIRTWDGTAELLVTHGPFGLNSIGLEVAEV